MSAHAYRAGRFVTGPSPDACYELVSDPTITGGRRFCLLPRADHGTDGADAATRLVLAGLMEAARGMLSGAPSKEAVLALVWALRDADAAVSLTARS